MSSLGAYTVTSKSRKQSVNSKTMRRTTAYSMTKAGSRDAGDYVQYHNTAGGEALSAMAPVSSLTGTGLKAGGVVKGPVNALIGEAGPEVVIPLKKKYMNKTVKEVARHFARKGAR